MMPRRMHAKVALGTVVGLLAWAPVALAKEAPPVSLALEECPHLSTPEIERIFAAELGAASTTTANPGVTEVTIVCSGVHVLVRVKDPLSRKTVQRSFDTSTFDPRATPRLVALAASELVLASWAELYSNPTPAVEPEGPVPSANATMAALSALRERTLLGGEVEPRPRPDPDEPDDRVLRLVALGSVRAFPGDSGALYGGGARLGEERFRLVAWALDTIIERGEVISRVGGQRIESTVTSATFGGSLLAYYSFQRVFTLRLGVGLRAGVVVANKPSVAPWGWPLGVTIWSLRAGAFVLDVSGEAGYVAFPISRGGEVRGYWLSGQVGVGMVL
jgi:hypothetical protein